MEKLFATVDALNEEYIKIWEDVCNIESPTKYKAGVDAVCSYLCDFALARGWKVEAYTQENLGNYACITLNPDAPGKPFSLSGHMDTVQEVGSFGTPAVRIADGKIAGSLHGRYNELRALAYNSGKRRRAQHGIGRDELPYLRT